MLSENQLKGLLSDLESDRVERTISTSNTDKFCEAISHARTFDALPCLESTFADLSEDRFTLTYLRRAVAEEEMVYDFPRVAIRELLLNAVIHRNYQANAPIRFYWFADHIRIDNPGGLYGEVSPENFPHTVDYRNPIIAEATRVLGYTNCFGQGIARIIKSLELNGNPPPEFTFGPHWFSVVMRPSL